MNIKMLSQITGLTVLLTDVFLVVPLLIALYDGQPRNIAAYAVTMVLMAVFGLALVLFSRGGSRSFYAQEGFAATGISWIVLSLFGALPFCLSGETPNYVDALFEIVSGFTTTGASILSDVEALSRCNLYWRSFSHWLGGMGILVFLLAVVPEARKSAGSGMYLMRAESPGPSVGKLTPHLRQTALILYGLYMLLTALCIGFLLLGGMPLFDSLCIAFGTAGTGGFAIRNSGMADYSAYLQNVVTVFMFLFGVNFNIYFLILTRRWKQALRIEELRVYLGVIAASALLIACNVRHLFGGFFDSLHHALFQVASIITTTGFATVDFNQWPAFSKCILVLLMFIGACAGSTGGGIKCSRVLLMCKSIKKEMQFLIHPRSVRVNKMDGRRVQHEVMRSVNVFLIAYLIIFILSTLALCLSSQDLVTNFTAVAATLNNVGPGLELVGPSSNFGFFDPLSKIVLMFNMLAGRLELFPMLLLFAPDTWRRNR